MGKGEDTKQFILNYAVKAASRLGLDALTIGKLCKGVGMSKSGLFAHFASKENLQIEILKMAEMKFLSAVVYPALETPRGEPRLRAIFNNWLKWENQPGGCLFLSSTFELDDKPGSTRDYLVRTQKDWMRFLAGAAQIAIDEGHFKPNLDIEQFVYDYYAVFPSYHYASRLLNDDRAGEKARISFDKVICMARIE